MQAKGRRHIEYRVPCVVPQDETGLLGFRVRGVRMLWFSAALSSNPPEQFARVEAWYSEFQSLIPIMPGMQWPSFRLTLRLEGLVSPWSSCQDLDELRESQQKLQTVNLD